MIRLCRLRERPFAARLEIARQISLIVDDAHRRGFAHPHLDLESVAVDDAGTVLVTGWEPARSPDDLEMDDRRLPEVVRAVLWPERRRPGSHPPTSLPAARIVQPRLWVETGAFALFACVVAAVAAFGLTWALTTAMVVLAVTLAGRRLHRRRGADPQLPHDHTV